MGDSLPEKRNKRKRKKSFLKLAKKYGKRGCYGRGQKLESDFYNYLVEILGHFKTIEDDNEKVLFVNNVFDQMKNQELECCFNQVGSRVIETLLPLAGSHVLEKLIEIISNDFRKVCVDAFASHVAETAFSMCCKFVLNSQTENPDVRETYLNFSIKMAKFLLNNLEDFIWNKYGNHMIRTVIKHFLMFDEDDSKKMLQDSDTNTVSLDAIPTEYKELVKEFSDRLLIWPQFLDLPYTDLTSGLLQVIIKALAKLQDKRLKSYFKKLINDCFSKEIDKVCNIDEKNISNDCDISKPAIALLEAFIQCSMENIFSKIHLKCFSSKLAQLAKERSTNFAVQKLLNNCNEKLAFESMFDELVDHFPEISEKQHTGVILAIGNACKRLSTKQGSYVQALMKLFQCFEPPAHQESLVLCLLLWSNYEDLRNVKFDNPEKLKLHLHGTLIIQTILNFNKPIKIVNSILNIESDNLKNIFSHSMGSHIVDSYVKSLYVGEKSREKLIRKLQGNYQELASSRYGSRAFDALWNTASIKNKLIIMNELAHKNASWSHSEYGRIIANKINLMLYSRNKEEWKIFINKNWTKNSLADIFT